MNTEDFSCNNGSDRQAIKGVHKSLPHFNVAAAFAFVVEAVDARHVGAFVISAQEEEIFGEAEFVA